VGGNVAKAPAEDENKSDIDVIGGGGALPPMKAAYVEKPVTGHIAAKFDENPAFQELKAQAQARLERGNAPTRPMGSPLAAIQSLGEALVAAGQEELEQQERLEGGQQEAVRAKLERGQGNMAVSDASHERGMQQEDILMIEQGASGELLQAAE